MHNRLAAVLLTMSAVLAGCAPQVKVPAFPGAEGFAAFTPGGRGGTVYEVTTLADDGPGSLRQAVEAKGRRIVVFRLSGNIALKSPLSITNPYITIAGQTAPGDGICVKDNETNISTHDVVIRFIRFRPGDTSRKPVDALGGRGCRNVIIDHCSASWSIDECVSFYHNENVTIQWCLIAESLFDSYHHKGTHGYGGIWGGNNGSLHHNLLAHHSSRNPRFASADHNVDFRNNVIYNWAYNSAYGGEGATVNIIANYFKPGPVTRDNVRQRIVEPYDDKGRWYIADNVMEGSPRVTADNWDGGIQGKIDPNIIRVDKPFPAAPVTTETAKQAYELVLASAGAILPRRDSLDRRIVEETRTATAHYGETYRGGSRGIINSQKAVGGWPALESAAPPIDSDHDAMPDDWEIAHGLDPHNPADGAKDNNGDGYTNVEEYLNQLVDTLSEKSQSPAATIQ